MDNTVYWNQFNKPPETALKKIIGGRLKGKTDINPQWRLKVLTQVFGPCGIGWYYDIVKMWTEQGQDNEVMAFTEIKLYIKVGEEWSKGIPGIGGSMLIAKERNGMHNSDEAYKMATTDALSVAMKCLGVASEIYEGNYDGSKYINQESEAKKESITQEQYHELLNINEKMFETYMSHNKITTYKDINSESFTKIKNWLLSQKG